MVRGRAYKWVTGEADQLKFDEWLRGFVMWFDSVSASLILTQQTLPLSIGTLFDLTETTL